MLERKVLSSNDTLILVYRKDQSVQQLTFKATLELLGGIKVIYHLLYSPLSSICSHILWKADKGL